jgi:MFS family permease
MVDKLFWKILNAVRSRVPLLRELPVEVTAMSAVAFCVALGFGILAPIIPAFAKEFGVSATAASAVISVFAAMRLVSAPPAARMLDRFGEQRVLSYGLLIVSASSFAAGLSQTYSQLIILRGLGGLGSTMFTVAAMAVILRVVDASTRGRASSAWSGGFLIGGLAGPAVGGFVAGISLRAPFFVYSGTLLLGSLVAHLALKKAHLNEHVHEKTDHRGWRELVDALRNSPYRAIIAVNFTNGLVRFGILNGLVALFVVNALKSNVGLASTGFLLSAIGQAALLTSAGRWTDTRGRKPIMMIGTIGTALGIATIGAFENIVMFFVAMLILGLSGALLAAAPSAILGDVTQGHPRGPVVAAAQMSSDFGGIVGPIIGGFLLDRSGTFDWPFFTGGALMLAVVFFIFNMPETLKRN